MASQSTATIPSMGVDNLCSKVPSQSQHTLTAPDDTTSPSTDTEIPKKKKTHRGVRGGKKVKEEAKRASMRKDKVQSEARIAVTTDAEEQVLTIGNGEWEVVVRRGKIVS
jgi:hypothetical protein